MTTVTPIEVGGQRIVYPRTYDRKYYGWFEITKSRSIGLVWIAVFTLLGLLVHIGIAIVLLMATFYLIAPTIDGHGYDTLTYRARSRRYATNGGYPSANALLDPNQEHPTPLRLVVYELPNNMDLAVVRNLGIRRDIVVLEITGWKNISTCDPLIRISLENSFNEIIQELTAHEYFSRFAVYSMRRLADDTVVWDELDLSSGDHPLRVFIDAAVDELYNGTDEDGPAVSTRFFFTFQTRVNANAQKFINSGQNLRRIPAYDSFVALVDALDTIEMRVEVPSEEGLATIMRLLHDPLDEHAAALLAENEILDREGDEGLDDKPLPLQRPAIPNYRVGVDWISFDGGSSYHTVLMQRRIKEKEPPPGWLDAFYAGGLSDFCVAGLTVDVIPKSGARTSASIMRRVARGRDHDKATRGSMPTAREEEQHDSALRAFDELDLSEGELATYCLYVIVSAASPEDLDDEVSTILKTVRKYRLTLSRVKGEARQLPAFHSAVGLM